MIGESQMANVATSDDPDRALVAAAQAGDEAAMEALYRRHAAAIHAYATRAAARRDVADEITQETFIRALRGIRRFDGRARFRTWLFSICINCTRTRLGRQQRRAPELALDSVELAGDLAVEPPPSRAWTRDQIVRALGALPEGYREAVILHDVLEMEHEEIASARGCTVGTSKSQLHKARAKLRGLLGPLIGDT